MSGFVINLIFAAASEEEIDQCAVAVRDLYQAGNAQDKLDISYGISKGLCKKYSYKQEPSKTGLLIEKLILALPQESIIFAALFRAAFFARNEELLARLLRDYKAQFGEDEGYLFGKAYQLCLSAELAGEAAPESLLGEIRANNAAILASLNVV